MDISIVPDSTIIHLAQIIKQKNGGQEIMGDRKIKKMVMAAMLAALVCVATIVIQIPSPTQGYVNLGDCFVLLSGWLLGPWLGAAAGGIGSMLAEIISGYSIYAPGTLVIKACMAMIAGLIYRTMKKKSAFAGMIVSGIPAQCIMIIGYFLYSGLILGKGLFGETGAVLSIPGNIVQSLIGIAAATAIMLIIRKTGLEKYVEK